MKLERGVVNPGMFENFFFLISTLLFEDGGILVRWDGDEISREPWPSTEGDGQEYCQISPCPPWG